MKLKTFDYLLDDIFLRYLLDEDTGQVAMQMLPAALKDDCAQRREWLETPELASGGLRCRAWEVGNLCHLALRHHPQSGGAGQTLRGGASTKRLCFATQQKTQRPWGTEIATELAAGEGYRVRHTVAHHSGEAGMEVRTEFFNATGKPVTLDLLTSFSLDNISPLEREDAPETYTLHRWRSNWSLEGKHIADTAEELDLERTWYNSGPESERWGCLGSHPVTRFFPLGAVEDKRGGVFWAAQLAHNASWQMEFSRFGDCCSLSGGLADSEFGAWWKTIADGESFAAPTAYISVARTLDDACQGLTSLRHKYADLQPQSEQSLPCIYNDWCATWGHPTHDGMLSAAKKLVGTSVKYIVVDAGWTVTNNDHLGQGGNGDWVCDTQKFPQGMLALSRELKALGFALGVWYEFEVTTRGARVFEKDYDELHVQRGGNVIVTGDDRSFWDFRKPEVIAYLKEKVIGFLRDNEISYMKVDYNGSIGAGCDGAESPGEGLRGQMAAVRDFFLLLREELPQLVIENCASGGRRLEPSMTDITAMSSFSDCHECLEIPRLAANLHNLILPRQSQIWAVVWPKLSAQELQYRLASGFLGRLCLSGDIVGLSETQYDAVRDSLRFYEACKEIIRCGKTTVYAQTSDNLHHLRGTQAVLRVGGDGARALLVCHSFAQPAQGDIVFDLPAGEWRVADSFGGEVFVRLAGNTGAVAPMPELFGFAVLFEKNK